MKKKIVALAIASAFSAPVLADNINVNFYGQAHVAYDQYSGDNATAAQGTQNGGQFAPGASRLGVKGSEAISETLKAVFQYETAVNLDGSAGLFGAQRDSYVGIAGDFGTVLTGRLPLANQYANDANFFGGKIGDAGNFTGANGVASRINHAIAYASPKAGGFSALIAYVPNTNLAVADTSAKSTVDTTAAASATAPVTTTTTQNEAAANKVASYTLRGDYAEGAVKAGLSYQSLATNSTKSAATIFSLSGGYDFGAGKIAVQYVSNTDIGQVSGAKQNIAVLGGSFKVSETDTLSAQYTNAGKVGSTANTEATGYALGYDHALSKRSTLYAAYAAVKNGSAAKFSATGYAHGGVAAPSAGENPSVFSLGVIHNF